MTVGSERLAEELGLEKLAGAERALAEEAVRIKARLDVLHQFLTASADNWEWFDLANRLGSDVDVTINAPLGEARQQAMALTRVLSEMRAMKGGQAEKAEPVPSKSDELKKRREQRLQREA